MTRKELVDEINDKESLLCVGLDSDIERIPSFLHENYDDPVLEFNRRVIANTSNHCVAYKINIAFYEARGPKGWDTLEKTLELIPSNILKIADAKRGDIGNTSKLYARTFFDHFDFDAITVAPYMGSDSLEPFYSYGAKWVIILGLTSNAGSSDFQMQKMADGKYLFEKVISRCSQYGNIENTMFVVGATQSEYLKMVREIIPEHFLLIPGIGSQGGNLQETLTNGLNDDYGLLINSSRGIIFASGDESFGTSSGQKALELKEQIGRLCSFH